MFLHISDSHSVHRGGGAVCQHALDGGVCLGCLPGGCMSRGVWLLGGQRQTPPPSPRRPLQWTVRILLECILVIQVIWHSEAFDITGVADKLRSMRVNKQKWFQYRGTDNDKQILWLSWL